MTSAGIDETIEPATWGAPVPDAEIAAVESWLGAPLPDAWKGYLQRDRWLRSGWLQSGSFVTIETPHDARANMEAWDEALDIHPGFYQLGTDGTRLLYCLDLRDLDLGVMVTDIVSEGWHEVDRLDLTVEEFIQRIDDGSLEPFPSVGA